MFLIVAVKRRKETNKSNFCLKVVNLAVSKILFKRCEKSYFFLMIQISRYMYYVYLSYIMQYNNQ